MTISDINEPIKFCPVFCSLSRCVASLTVPDGQQFHFPHISSNFPNFCPHFGPPDGRVGEALATALSLSCAGIVLQLYLA